VIESSRRESLARKKNKQAQKDKKALKDKAQEAKKPKKAASALDSPAADAAVGPSASREPKIKS
jgi:hypothetical protein